MLRKCNSHSLYLQSSSFTDVVDNVIQSDEREILNTILKIFDSFPNDFIYNAYSNGVFIPETYMLAKKFIFFTNFVSEYISQIDQIENIDIEAYGGTQCLDFVFRLN